MTKVCQCIEVGLRDTLHKSAEELGHLSELIEPLEIALEGVSLDLDRVVQQNIDLISQRIEAVSDFLMHVAHEIPSDTKLNVGAAIASVRLEATRKRLVPGGASGDLSSEVSAVTKVNDADAHGVPDLF